MPDATPPKTEAEHTTSARALLARYPAPRTVEPSSSSSPRGVERELLVVIDDDPTGSQSVSDIPVLTSWRVDDFVWAFAQHRPAIFVLTNSRSVDAREAVRRTESAVRNATAAASGSGVALTFLSRGDSLLRGHFPDETDAIVRASREAGAAAIDGIVLVPAFPRAGRVTVEGIHYLQDGDALVPAAETQFAQDASFGYRNSDLRRYVEEKTGGRVSADDVTSIDLGTIRESDEAIAKLLEPVSGERVVVADCVTDDDMRALCAGLALAESRGKTFLFRTGPAFVGARIGEAQPEPISVDDVMGDAAERTAGGLIVVGSHVDLTNRQLDALRAARPDLLDLEIDVEAATPTDDRDAADYVRRVAQQVGDSLAAGDVMIRTSRVLRAGATPDESLRIARSVSVAMSSVVRAVVGRARPRFVVAKGGITSNDTATEGLEIRRGTIRGPMLPGMVSLWQAADGPAAGIPYVVFPGNVGGADALLDVVGKLSRYSTT